MLNYEEMLDFVKETLEKENGIKPNNPHHQFRDRFMHTKRVLEWTKIIKDDLEVDLDVLYTSAIFHDVGSSSRENHAYYGAKIFEKYAIEHDFNKDFIDKVYNIILVHSNKDLIRDKNSSNELVLLLEADLLDEEGALGIVWDLMALGSMGGVNYYDAIDALKHAKHILKQDYMITPIARQIWEKKKDLVKCFTDELERDLFL